MTELIKIDRQDAIARVTLNRPDALNALSGELLRALGDAIAELARDSSLRALVLGGEGRAFAAGADIEEMRDMNPVAAEEFSRLGHAVFGALEALPIPTIAAVKGYALGGGCELALSCDWIYAAKNAKFGQPEVKLGLIPGFGGTSRLARRVGVAWAKELVLTGRKLNAEEAQRIGLVNRVFEVDDLIAKSLESAREVARAGPVAVRLAKRVIQEGQGANLYVAHALEQNTFGLVFASEDRDEGIDAFLAKRDPAFKGR